MSRHDSQNQNSLTVKFSDAPFSEYVLASSDVVTLLVGWDLQVLSERTGGSWLMVRRNADRIRLFPGTELRVAW